MKVSKLDILYYFLRLRFSRLFRSNKVSRRMKRKWRHTLTLSPYYRRLLLEGQKFPIMNKTLFMRDFDRINTVGVKKDEALKVAFRSEKSRDFSPSINEISVGLSSGTSGNRGIFLTSKKEKAIWVGAVLDRVIGFSLKKRKVAFFLRANNNLYEAVNSRLLDFRFFDIKNPIEDNFDVLKDFEADILVGQPSVLIAIAKRFESLQIKSTFSSVISVAEVLEDDYKEILNSIFNCPIKQVYQCTEGFLAYTCRKGKLHINEDWLEIEKKYVDGSKTRFHPVITDYLRTSQPVVRYELNDILHEDPRACDCGSKSTVILKIEGRSDDVFRFTKEGKEVIIYPDFIRRAVLRASGAILEYTVTLVDQREIHVSLEVEGSTEWSRIFQDVKFELQKLMLEYGIEDVHLVGKSHVHKPLTKFRRIKNEYSKSIQN